MDAQKKEGPPQSLVIQDSGKGETVRNNHYIIEIPSDTKEVTSSIAVVPFKVNVALGTLSLKRKAC